MRGSQAARQVQRIKGAIAKAAILGQDRAAKEIKQYSVSLSSGKLSTAWLRKDDHPYATRHGAQQNLSGLINRQSGVLKASWEIRKVQTAFSAMPIIVVVNRASYVQYVVFGTSKMVPRRIDLNIESRWGQILEKYVLAEIQRIGMTK